MRTPWALFAVFAVGAAAGAATVLLLRIGEVPRSALEAPATENPPAAVPVPSDPGVTAREPSAPPAPWNQALAGRTEVKALPVDLDAERAEDAADVVAARKFVMLVSTRSMVKELRSNAEAEAALRRILADPASEAVQEDRREMLAMASQLWRNEVDTGAMAAEFLGSPDAELRKTGISLAQGKPTRLDLLLEACSDPDPSVRQWALTGLNQLGWDGRATARDLEAVVFKALRDPYAEVRAAAMELLRYLGPSGAAEAVRILRSGASRESGAGPRELVEAALAGAPAALLADPLPQHLAEDICVAVASFPSHLRDLVLALAPHAARVLAALPPGAREPAEMLLDALATVGETSVLRQVLADPSVAPRIRSEAADALSHGSAPAEWRPAVASWLLDSRVDLQVRRQYVADHASCYPPSEEDGDAAHAAWMHILRAVAQGADDPGLAADAAKALEDNERR